MKAELRALGIREAGAQIGLAPRAAYRAAKSGAVPAVKIGGKWVVPCPAWEKFLNGDWTQKRDNATKAAQVSVRTNP